MARVRGVAMDLLARREHSLHELQHKLKDKGFPSDLVGEVAAALARERLVSDDRFAESFVHARLRRGYGPMKIRAELRERGVDNDVIEKYLNMPTQEWNKLVTEVRGKRFGAGVPADFRERARQARFLQSRGFTHDQIHKVLSDFDPVE